MTNGEKFQGVEEREKAFKAWERKRHCPSCSYHLHCGARIVACALHWLDLEVDAEKPEPCPFCGSKDVSMKKATSGNMHIRCWSCGYESAGANSTDEVIARHNELCRKLKGENA